MEFILKNKKTSLIIVVGEKRNIFSEVIFSAIKSSFPTKKLLRRPNYFDVLSSNVFIISLDIKKDYKDLKFLLKSSVSPILVLSKLDEKDFLAIQGLVEVMPKESFLVINSDDSLLKKVKSTENCKIVKFGFDDLADFKASDLNETNDSVNFKMNYRGSFVPIWLPSNLDGREKVYAVLSAVCISNILGMNIIQTASNLKNSNLLDKV
jgi:hypothetical protein